MKNKKSLRDFVDVVSVVLKENESGIRNFCCVTKNTLLSKAKRKKFYFCFLLFRKRILCALINKQIRK